MQISPELLSDVVNTVGILKCQIELVFSQYIETLRAVPGTLLSSTVTVDINYNMFLQFLGVLQSVVPGVAVTEGRCSIRNPWAKILFIWGLLQFRGW